MFRRIALSFFFLNLFCSSLLSQNLVLNASFEEVLTPMNKFSDVDGDFEKQISLWKNPNTGTPDLISPDFNEPYIRSCDPHSGQFMAGISADNYHAEYIGAELKEPLQANQLYYVEFWIRRAWCKAHSRNTDQVLNSNYGILFLDKEIKAPVYKPLIGFPQVIGDTTTMITDTSWHKISNYFIPKTDMGYMYLGQFKSKDADFKPLDRYFFIDDITVEKVKDLAALAEYGAIPVGTVIPLRNIQFKSGTTELRDELSYTTILDLVRFMNKKQDIRLRINGHTDAKGTKNSNMSLSERRAAFVAKKLIELGVDEKRIEWKGYGEELPVAENDTASGRALNRRVEIEMID